MFRRLFMIFTVIVCMSVFGCSTMRYLDGSSDEDMEKFRVSKDALWNEVKKLKQDQEASQNTIQQKQGEINRLNQQVVSLKEGMDASLKEMEKLQTERQAAEEAKKKDTVKPAEAGAMAEKPVAAEEKKSEMAVSETAGLKKDQISDSGAKDAVQTAVVEKGIEPKMVKVKVLSGNGKISSAKAVSKKLAALGYRIENIGKAPRSNFNVSMVYYAPGYQSEAQRMAAHLGSDAVSKPLTWSSTFHIIVVTGP